MPRRLDRSPTELARSRAIWVLYLVGGIATLALLCMIALVIVSIVVGNPGGD